MRYARPAAGWLGVAGLVVAAFASAGAGATTVSCGDTLTLSTTLTADLNCSGLPAGGTALTVAGDHITLDLNGHTIA